VLGSLPRGLPTFSIPWIPFADLVPVIIGGFAVALVSFADTSVLSRTYAARTGTRVDPNQEMVGLGAANLAAGFFQGFPVSSSSSRTPVAEAAGSRTQLTGVVGALLVALLLLAAPDLLKHVPTAALAAVVISSAIGLFEVNDLKRLFKIQRWEFWLSMVCFAGVAVFGAIEGVGIAVVIAVLEFLWDGWRPHSAVLGRVEGVRGYHDITRYPDARQLPGLVLFRWDAPLFFANAELFKDSALDAVATAPTPVEWLVVAAEPVTSVDVTAADALSELNETLRHAQTKLCFAELKDPVKDKLSDSDCSIRSVNSPSSRPLAKPWTNMKRGDRSPRSFANKDDFGKRLTELCAIDHLDNSKPPRLDDSAEAWKPRPVLSLLAGVPESRPIARVAVIPAQSRRGRRACVDRCSPRSEHADSSAGRDRAARTPAIAGPRPAAISASVDPCAAIDAAAIDPTPVGAATIAANGGSAAMVDAAAWPHSGSAAMRDERFRDHLLAQLRRRVRALHLNGAGLRRTKTQECNRHAGAFDQTRPNHAFLSLRSSIATQTYRTDRRRGERPGCCSGLRRIVLPLAWTFTSTRPASVRDRRSAQVRLAAIRVSSASARLTRACRARPNGRASRNSLRPPRA
jgi:hypothetical protein